MLDPIRQLCQQNNLPFDEGIAEDLEAFLDLLDDFRDSMNLIGPLSDDAIVRELLADSIAPAAARAPTGPILDVGSGAGFPGIPLAILYPDLPTRLVEPRQKRHTFLKIARTRLDLDNLTLERARLEQLNPSPHNYVISKAFKPPDEWLPLAKPWLARSPHEHSPGAILCMTRPDARDSIATTATHHDLTLANFIPDTTTLGAPTTQPPRAIAVVTHQ